MSLSLLQVSLGAVGGDIAPAGKYSAVGASAATPCPAGKYSEAAGNTGVVELSVVRVSV